MNLLAKKNVALRLSVSVGTVEKLIRRGEIPAPFEDVDYRQVWEESTMDEWLGSTERLVTLAELVDMGSEYANAISRFLRGVSGGSSGFGPRGSWKRMSHELRGQRNLALPLRPSLRIRCRRDLEKMPGNVDSNLRSTTSTKPNGLFSNTYLQRP